MDKLTSFFVGRIKSFAGILFGQFSMVFRDLGVASDGVPLKYLISDFFTVLRGTGMFLVLNEAALLVFVALPQGKDILLIVVEEVGIQFRFGNLIFLLLGVTLWAIVSEYGTRYAIYVTDNSAKSISGSRIVWRKAVQKAVAQVFLMLPFIIVLLGFAINYINDTFSHGKGKYFGYGVPVLSLYLLFSWVSRFYFDKERRRKLKLLLQSQPKNNGGGYVNKCLKLLMLPEIESKWCDKLLGIYNNFVFSIRKPSNFTDKINPPYKIFCENFISADESERNHFPQNDLYLDKESIVPASFILKDTGFTDEMYLGGNSMPEGEYKWEYIIPRSFYKVLHKQLIIIVGVCSFIFFFICCLNVRYYTNIGTPALVVIAFACYSAFYLGLLFLDYCIFKYKPFSARFTLLCLLTVSSLINKDHPVRYNEAGKNCDKRPSLKAHFTKWLNKYTSDSAVCCYQQRDSLRIGINRSEEPYDTFDKKPFYPVFFICAEGGASRTGAYVSSMLSLLQDSLCKINGKSKCAIDFKKSIYAFSSVSGGSLGVSLFNGMAYLNDRSELLKDSTYSQLTKIFFNEDFLSPVIGKMFYGDIVNLFLPWHIDNFDRAISLEKSWENAYTKITNSDSKNVFSSNYLDCFNNEREVFPAQFINTTEVETGKQCWVSNIKPNDSEMIFAHERDLLNFKIKGGINVSTATNFSTRFPLISPGAALLDNDLRKYHYVDGGYVENTGCATMLEVLKALEPLFNDTMRHISIKPYVIVLRFNEEVGGKPSNINLGNELTEIITGLYNTRTARVETAIEELKRFLDHDNICGKLIILPISKTGDEVPLNWVFSQKSLDKIQLDVAEKWKRKDENDLKKLIFLDTAYTVARCK